MKDMTQLEQRLAQPKAGPKEYEKIRERKKMYSVHFVLINLFTLLTLNLSLLFIVCPF